MLRVVTVATRVDRYMKWLRESCQRHGTEIVILGMGATWEGFSTKFKIMTEYLSECADDDVICFVDAYDVIMIDSSQKLYDRFLEFKSTHSHKMICAVDNGYSVAPGLEFMSGLIDLGMLLCFEDERPLNSGTYVGFAKDLREILTLSLINTSEDDQTQLNLYHKMNPGAIYADSCSQWFSTIQVFDDLEDYGQTGFFIHRPGCLPLKRFLLSRGYHMEDEEIQRIDGETRQEVAKKVVIYSSMIANGFLGKLFG